MLTAVGIDLLYCPLSDIALAVEIEEDLFQFFAAQWALSANSTWEKFISITTRLLISFSVLSLTTRTCVTDSAGPWPGVDEWMLKL